MQHTAVNLVTMSWAPLNRWNFIEESHRSFRSVLLSLWKTFISDWYYVSAAVPSHTRVVPKVSVLIFYLNFYWTHLKLQVISFKV